MATSTEHEQLLELFRERKELLQELLEPLGIELSGEAEPEPGRNDLTQPKPIIRVADLILLHRQDGRVVHGTIVEIQLDTDTDKPFRWPLYAATLRDRERCEVRVVVVAPDPGVARWASRPISTGGGNIYRVTVLGPDQIPRPTSPSEPHERLLLAARAHPDREAARVAVEAADRLPSSKRAGYIDALLALLPEPVRTEVMKMLSSYERLYPQSDFAKEHYGKGLLEGQAELLVRQLTRRFGELPADTVDRVRAADGYHLLLWGDRVLDAPSLDDVFAEED